jgi:hypothetical protein
MVRQIVGGRIRSHGEQFQDRLVTELPSTLDDHSTNNHFNGNLLPVQYYAVRRNLPEGEYRLLVAVLEQAIRSYLLNCKARTSQQRKAFAEIREWFSAPEIGSPQEVFSFLSICDLLAIDAETLRRRLSLMSIRSLPTHRQSRHHALVPRRRTRNRRAALGVRITRDQSRSKSGVRLGPD